MQHGQEATTRSSRGFVVDSGMDEAEPETNVAAPDEPERLQRFLARAGVASRRKAETLITDGRVTVDGAVASLGQKVTAGARVRVDGVDVRPVAAHRTFALYKPTGVVTTASDERGRPTVLDLVPALPGLHPVGRLDLDSEGLLLLTTDGDLTLRLTHPRYGHLKTYRVWCREGAVSREGCRALVAGVALDDGLARARRAQPAPGGVTLELGEGRKRQVRRMLAAVGYEVVRLLRTRVGDLALGDLAPGSYRELTSADLRRLGYTPDQNDAGTSSTASKRRARTPGRPSEEP